MKNCPACGEPNRDDALFCSACGARFPQQDQGAADPGAPPARNPGTPTTRPPAPSPATTASPITAAPITAPAPTRRRWSPAAWPSA